MRGNVVRQTRDQELRNDTSESCHGQAKVSKYAFNSSSDVDNDMLTTMETIRASIVDGIAVNARYRERSLVALHRALESFRSDLIDVLQDGVSTTTARSEAEAQYIMTLHAITEFHKSTDPMANLKQEYQPARSQNDSGKRIPYGYAYIQSHRASHPLYSLVVSVAAAIAAGNCVIIEQPTPPKQDSRAAKLLRTVLEQGISREILLYVTADPFEDDFKRKYCILVHQKDSESGSSPVSNTLGTSNRLRVAIVERSCDAAAAAPACVVARFGFSGTSAYAPDVVLVNEFCVEAFGSAAVQAALPFLSATQKQTIEQSQKSSGNTLISGDGGAIVVLDKNDHDRALAYEQSPLLKIMPVSSGEACIALLNQQQRPLLVNYIFAQADMAKYLSQFIRSSISIVNHIPAELLVGPAAPDGFPTSIHPRYAPEMFSMASPVIVEQPASVSATELIWSSGKGKAAGAPSFDKWLGTSIQPYKEPFGPTVGFFEQGLLFGVGCILTTVIVSGTVAVKYGYPMVVKTLSR